jgi:hypothetical protein
MDRLALQAATELALESGVHPDRCDVLQDGNTLVLRLTETLVARVVQELDGPRQGMAWFARETALARYLSAQGAPVIPLHPDLPPGPHERYGFPVNFWLFVSRIDAEPDPHEMGRTLRQCHAALSGFKEELPQLAILHESLSILQGRELFPAPTQRMLLEHLQRSILRLEPGPHQPLHGDAHPGNLLHTTRGLLWTDWEDAFSGPVEWDLASLLWNILILDDDQPTADAILEGYREEGGAWREDVLRLCLVARAAVMTTWYPILYPNPDAERREKLQRRLDWLGANSSLQL